MSVDVSLEKQSPRRDQAQATPPAAQNRVAEPAAQAVAILAALCAVAILLVNRHYAGGLWRDEVNSVNFTNLPTVRDMWRLLDNESFPMLWLLLERGWCALLGTSDAVLRDIGLLVALALLAAVWGGARRCGYRPALTMALLAVNPVLLRVAASNRAYGFGFLLLVLTYYALWKYAQAPARRRALLAGLLALLATQTLYYDIVFVTAAILGAAGVLWFRDDRRALRPLAAIWGLCALSLIPYIFGPIRQERAWSFLIAYHAPHIVTMPVLKDGLGMSGLYGYDTRLRQIESLSIAAAWLAILALCVYGLKAYLKKPSPSVWQDGGDAARYASVTALVFLVGYVLVLKNVGYFVETFHLSVLALVLAVAGGHLLSTFRPRWNAPLAAAALAALLLIGNLPGTVRQALVRQSNADIAAAVVAQQARPGDFIIIAPYWMGQSFARYYGGTVPWTTPPTLPQYAYGGETDVLRQMISPPPDVDHTQRIQATLRSGHSVWLVYSVHVLPSLQEVPVLPALPPPTPPGTRQSMMPFLDTLDRRVVYTLGSAQTAEPIPLPSRQPVNDKENYGVTRYAGWKERTSAQSE